MLSEVSVCNVKLTAFDCKCIWANVCESISSSTFTEELRCYWCSFIHLSMCPLQPYFLACRTQTAAACYIAVACSQDIFMKVYKAFKYFFNCVCLSVILFRLISRTAEPILSKLSLPDNLWCKEYRRQFFETRLLFLYNNNRWAQLSAVSVNILKYTVV